jgi:hypothetical protein
MYIHAEEVSFLAQFVVGFGIFGWIASKLKPKKPTQESARSAVSQATKAVEHNRKYGAAGRAEASKSRVGETTERAPRRRIKKAISRNQESRSAYRRRTSSGR